MMVILNDFESRWIRCSERMPDGCGTFIVCGKMKYSFEKDYEYFVDAADYPTYEGEFPHGNCPRRSKWGTWNDWFEGQDEYEIIAWMPMPEPLRE